MSQIVRCPECRTLYKLVPDQLKIARGWLRCGLCQHAFDSTGLVVLWPEASLSEHPATDLDGRTQPRLVINDLLKQEDRTEQSPLQTVAAFEEALASFKPASLVHAPDASMPIAASEPSAEHLVQRATAKGWLLPFLSVSSVLLLSLALLLQGLWIERHALVAAQPDVGRLWQRVCQAWACEIDHPQVRNGMVIDHSSLTPREEGGWLLSWSWRNATAQTLATPALELTLMDGQDKALVRRVLPVAELGAPRTLGAGQTWDGQLHLAAEEGLVPSGYRLLSFYP